MREESVSIKLMFEESCWKIIVYYCLSIILLYLLMINDNGSIMVHTLKFLIDSLFFLLCLGIIGFFFVLPFGIFTTKIADVEFQGYEGYRTLPFLYWVGIGMSIATYILFLLGLNYLRKAAEQFVGNSFYSTAIIRTLRLSGIFFVITGILLALTYTMFWAMETAKGTTKLILGTDIMVPMFLGIMCLFFILQCKVFNQSMLFKVDSNLTI